jgi:MoxR-like ATPase
MPGQLRPDAKCPCCGNGLLFIVDTSNTLEVVREYHHEKPSPKARRRRFCTRVFVGHYEKESAKKERWSLETTPIGSRPN